MSIATEIVIMKTTADVTKDAFISIIDGLEKNFHSKQPGFIDTELLYNDKADEWIIIQHWDSLDHLKASSKKMFDTPATEPFVKSLIQKSVKMIMLPQLGRWDNETV